jgi:hypothetical protein
MKTILFALMTVCCLCSLAVGPTYAQEEEFQGGGSGDCIASWDPFCPQGTPWEESDPAPGTGDPGDCYVCETGYIVGVGNAQVCVSAGSTGRTVCDDGLLYSYCDLSGAFCDSVTVTP